MHRRVLLTFALLALTACPEPPRTAPGGGAPEMGGTVGSPPAGGGPGDEGQPASGPTRVAPAGWTADAASGVRISGTIAYAGSKEGTLRIDFLKMSSGSTMPTLEHTLTLPAPGPWEVYAPKDLGSVNIFAFIDLDENGPSPGEPKAAVAKPVEVATLPVEGINLTIRDDWDQTEGQKERPPGQQTRGGPPPPP